MRLILLFLFICSLLNAQPVLKSIQEELQDSLLAIQNRQEFPGACVSVVFNDAHAFRMVSKNLRFKEDGTLTPDSQMLSGSTGKMFFSAVILKLIEKGGLSLDDKADDYLSEYDWYSTFPNSEEITIRQLMNHSSGLPRYVFQGSFLEEIQNNPTKDRKPVDCIQLISNMDSVHKPGEGWAYSDTNYILLGLIYEKITGRKIYDAVKEEVLIPAGLSLTKPSVSRKLPGLVQGYVGDMNPFGLPDKVIADDGLLYGHPGFEWTGGGYMTNAYDLAALLKYIHESNYLSEKTKKALVSPVDFKTGKPSHTGYGLGSFVWDNGDQLSYGHSGFFPGYLSYAVYVPTYQYAIGIQINHDGYGSSLSIIANTFRNILDSHMEEIDAFLIHENFEKHEDCWNNADLQCYMEAYSNIDSIQTISRGGVTSGYDNILSNYQRYYPEGKMGKLHFDKMETRKLTDDLNFVTGRFNLDMPGRDELVQGYFSTVCRKIGGKWYIITDHSS